MNLPDNKGVAQQNLSLDAIGLKYRTDKSSWSHDYLSFYETYFAPMRNEKLKILEIGIFNGASLSTWAEYFPNANIVGADINAATRQYARERVAVEILDQSDIEQLVQVAVKHGPFDIIIEDGSHMWEHQITSLRTLFPFVRNNGIYIVEDLQTNYRESYRGVASITCMEYLKRWLDLLVGDALVPLAPIEDAFLRTYGRSAKFISFYRHACLIKKQVSIDSHDVNFAIPLVRGTTAGKPVPVRITAHVSFKGNVTNDKGYLNPPSDRFTFQGLTLQTEGNLLEYRVRGEDGAWSPWSDAFAGTRGKAKPLTGIAVRLKENVKGRYSVRTVGRFADETHVIDVSDGEDCVSPAGKALCGLHVMLNEKAGRP